MTAAAALDFRENLVTIKHLLKVARSGEWKFLQPFAMTRGAQDRWVGKEVKAYFDDFGSLQWKKLILNKREEF